MRIREAGVRSPRSARTGGRSGRTLAGGPNRDFVDVDTGRQGQQPADALGDVARFEQGTELNRKLTEFLRIVTGNLLELRGDR